MSVAVDQLQTIALKIAPDRVDRSVSNPHVRAWHDTQSRVDRDHGTALNR
jgi:hypothetical protein